MSNRVSWIVLSFACVIPIHVLAADKPTKVALTTTVRSSAARSERELAENLLTLMEMEVSQQTTIQIVERMQLDLALYELVLSRSRGKNDRGQPQLGKLASADLILIARLLAPVDERGPPKQPNPPDNDADQQQKIEVRIVDALTGTIRGATMADISAATVEEAAAEIARYLSAVVDTPHLAGTSVAVAPFESLGRFDRLRPLELGVRNILTARLLRYAGYQVLQRSDMQHLLAEIDLVRSGLSDSEQLPETLPRREAVYYLHGTIDERNDGDRQLMIRGQLTHADTGKTVLTIDSQVQPPDVIRSLTMHADRVAQFLTENQPGGDAPRRENTADFEESDVLFADTVRDMYRLRRLNPRDFSYRDFRLPGRRVPVYVTRRLVPADSPLGKHLLKKSVDRLESLQYLQPDRVDVRYALAFCLSYHMDGMWRPERAEELLRHVYQVDPKGQLAKPALDLLAELYFHHKKGRVAAQHGSAALRNLLFAFRNMPVEHRDYQWSRMLELVVKTGGSGRDYQMLSQTLHEAAAWVGTEADQSKGSLAFKLGPLAEKIVRQTEQPELQVRARSLLMKWSASDDHQLHYSGSWSLAHIAEFERDYAAAAKWYLHAADAYQDSTVAQGQHRRDNLRIHAARNLRQAGSPQAAIDLLGTFLPADAESLNYGYYGKELGASYQALGDTEQALESYVRFAESSPSLVDNSDIVRRIQRLGGVPLRADRDIDVTVVAGTDGNPFLCRVLATDGRRVFCGGDYREPFRRGVSVYDISSRSWRKLEGPTSRVSCLEYQDGVLWVGTDDEGVWRCDLSDESWKQWSLDRGLPDKQVTAIAVHEATAFVSVGSPNSGGIVRMTGGGVEVYEQESAPRTACDTLTIFNGTLYAVSQGVFTLDITRQKWAKLPPRGVRSAFAGAQTVWASKYGQELFSLLDHDEKNVVYRQAWFPRGTGKAGYHVSFVIERDGQLWFGGAPWRRFLSAGFYRLDMSTGEFTRYGPRDGIPLSTTYTCYDGLWTDDRFWLASSAGLLSVSIIDQQ